MVYKMIDVHPRPLGQVDMSMGEGFFSTRTEQLRAFKNYLGAALGLIYHEMGK